MSVQMRNASTEKGVVRETQKCATAEVLTLCCDLIGYDIKTLNSTTGKGSYMLKIGQKKVTVPYTSARKQGEKTVTMALYKLKGLRGLLRRAAELRLLRLKEAGKVAQGPCAPSAHYPHEELLEQHIELGYHPQGSCHPRCFIHRLYGALDRAATVTLFPPYIAKATVENLPAGVTAYLDAHIEELFGLEDCVVFHNGEAMLKTEVFNIINRATEQAVNNFMKHNASGRFKFKVVFMQEPEGIPAVLENLGFFLTTLFEINAGRVQLGSCRSSGAGRVQVRVLGVQTPQKVAEFDPYIQEEIKHSFRLECGPLALEECVTRYVLNPTLLKHAYEAFTTQLEA